MIKVGALSDTHIDEKAAAAGRIILDSDGRNLRAKDRELCLASAIDGAIERDVDIIIHGGDLVDHSRPTPAEYCIVERELDKAALHSWTVLAACNHMLSQSPTEQHGIAPLAGRHERLWIALRPEMRTIPTKSGDLIQVAVLPYPAKSILLAKEEYAGLAPEAVNHLIGEKLAAIVRGFRAHLDPTVPSVLLTHIMVKEAIFGDDQQADFGMLAMSVEDFAGFDLVVAGDVHRHQMIGERFLIPGSTDRCSFGEEREAKGWCYVELDGPGAVPRVELVETPARRFVTLSVDELVHSEPLPEIVYRVKGNVSQEEYDRLGPDLARWRNGTSLFSESIEVVRQTRARSEEMRGNIGPEAALRLWHQVNSRQEPIEDLHAAHRAIVGVAK